jgi:hypothetical protein
MFNFMKVNLISDELKRIESIQSYEKMDNDEFVVSIADSKTIKIPFNEYNLKDLTYLADDIIYFDIEEKTLKSEIKYLRLNYHESSFEKILAFLKSFLNQGDFLSRGIDEIEYIFEVRVSNIGKFAFFRKDYLIIWDYNSGKHFINKLKSIRGVEWNPINVEIAIFTKNDVFIMDSHNPFDVCYKYNYNNIKAFKWDENGE